MRNTNPNTYIQYVNENGHVKTVQVDRQVEATEIIYTTPPITENFFILSLFDLNQRVYGLTFANYQNVDALGFLNSEFQTLEALPPTGFFSANSEVSIVKDTANYDLNFNVIPSVVQQINETQELIFLKSYLKNNFDDGTYVITPEIRTLESYGTPIIPDNFTLYYARLTNSSNAVINNGILLTALILPANSLHFHYFTDIAGLEYNCQLIGYKVVFNHPIYSTGGGGE
ncbi:hypothetical protein FNW25_01440 [Flavobacterium franklandianum]|uniref:hypothetical protein n=1 Tax=Flavobacterium franklandianum TaxID=2594430 RepID=UPI00117AD350|nr:hypothetical protein [Flavobacterium franklandianum]TRX29650.1 hypothetical protein FNW25_01440 [Flavobacterium franklandianum]